MNQADQTATAAAKPDDNGPAEEAALRRLTGS